MTKKRKINFKKISLIVVLLLVVVLIIIIIKNTSNKNPNNKKNEVTESITNFPYTLKENDTPLVKDLFSKLKEQLSQDQINEEQYAKLVAQLFVADFYTINNKISNDDIGGIQFVHPDIRANFILKAKDTIYKYVKNNIYGNRHQELPIVTNVKIENITKENYQSKNHHDKNSYHLKMLIEYAKDLEYPTQVEVALIHYEEKLYIIEVK